MSKRKKEQSSLSFSEYLGKFPATTLQSAVMQLEGSIAWGLMSAFLKANQRNYEVAALDLVKHDGQVQAAAHASGYAQACEDVANIFMQQLKDSVNGVTGLVEGPIRDDVE